LTGPDGHVSGARRGTLRVDRAALEDPQDRVESPVVAPLRLTAVDAVGKQFVGVAALSEPDLQTAGTRPSGVP